MNHALKLARTGKVVFPCDNRKRPLVRWRDAATSDCDIIAEWWTQWQGAMVGLPCGAANGLFVLDVDCDRETGEAVGEQTLADLGYARLLSGPRVRTPSGGVHLYFRHWKGARNSVSGLGPKLDTRTDGGYVIAAGSQGSAGRYVGAIDWDSLPDFPLGLRARATAPRTAAGAGMPGVLQRHEEAPDSEVEALLSHVPPDCDYQTWLSVLMALHDRYGGSEAGLALADAWSARGAKYRPGEVAQKWRSFKGSGVTFATLPAIARSYGADLSGISRDHRRAANG